MANITIINGPNLNLLGKREPEIYGSQAFEDYLKELQARFPDVQFSYFQSNHEGAIIDKLHEVGFSDDGVILNAGAYSHYSYAIADAIKAIASPVVEVHISNVLEREEWRHTSVISPNCAGNFTGLGMDGYAFAVEAVLSE